MPYQYVAYTEEGNKIRGTTDAPSSPSVEETLWRQNYFIVDIQQVPPPMDWREQFPTLFGVKVGDVIIFTRQLATLVNSGVALIPALVLLQEQVSSPPFRKALRDITQQIETGSSVSVALQRYPGIFPGIYLRMVEVGERTGRLESLLDQVASYMEKQQAIIGRIKGALMYPLFIGVLATAVIGLLVTFALPAMVGIFKEFKADLPWTTSFLVALSDFARNNFLNVTLGLAVGSVFITAYTRTAAGKRQFHISLLRLPVMGQIIIKGSLTNFTRSMAILLRAGIPLPDIMDLTAETVDNVVIKDSLQQLKTGLLQGHGLAYPLSQDPLFPKLLSQMVKVGEESGALDNLLDSLAAFYEKETDRAISEFTSKIEPTLIIVIGALVGFIAIAIITPMYTLINKIGG